MLQFLVPATFSSYKINEVIGRIAPEEGINFYDPVSRSQAFNLGPLGEAVIEYGYQVAKKPGKEKNGD